MEGKTVTMSETIGTQKEMLEIDQLLAIIRGLRRWQ